MRTAPGTNINLGAIDVQFLVEAQSDGAATVFECAVGGEARCRRPTVMTHSTRRSTGSKASSRSPSTAYPGDRAGRLGLHPPRPSPPVRQPGDRRRKFLSVATPGVFGPDYFTQIRDVVSATSGAAHLKLPLLVVMRRHGLTPA